MNMNVSKYIDKLENTLKIKNTFLGYKDWINRRLHEAHYADTSAYKYSKAELFDMSPEERMAAYLDEKSDEDELRLTWKACADLPGYEEDEDDINYEK